MEGESGGLLGIKLFQVLWQLKRLCRESQLFLTREEQLWSEAQPAEQVALAGGVKNSIGCAGGSSWEKGAYLITLVQFIDVLSGKAVLFCRETAFSRKC